MVHAGSIGLFIVKLSLFWQLEASYERNHCDLRGSEKLCQNGHVQNVPGSTFRRFDSFPLKIASLVRLDNLSGNQIQRYLQWTNMFNSLFTKCYYMVM